MEALVCILGVSVIVGAMVKRSLRKRLNNMDGLVGVAKHIPENGTIVGGQLTDKNIERKKDR